MDASVKNYIDFILSRDSGVSCKGKYISGLHTLMKKTTPQLFITAIKRAMTYKITSIHQMYNIFSQILKQPLSQPLPSESVGSYQQRPEYIEGRFTQENELELPD